jgi:hypothetical protein
VSSPWGAVQDTKKIELRQSKPINEGYEKYLYKIDTDALDNGNEYDAFEIEKGFGNFESVVSPIIKKVRETFELPTGDELNILINFIALQVVRVPSHIHNFDKPLQDVAKMSMKMMMSSKDIYESSINQLKKDQPDLKVNIGYESMKKFVNSEKYNIIIKKNFKLSMMLNSIDTMISLLSSRNWSLWISADPMNNYICSDNPVTLTWSNGLPRPGLFKGPGFGMNNTDVIMPLSKNIAMVGKFESNNGAIANGNVIANINTRVMMFASRHIYSNNESFCWIDKNNRLDYSANYLEELKK